MKKIDRPQTVGRKVAEGSAKPEALEEMARHLETRLNFIQRRIRQGLSAEFAKVQVTGPQRLVMTALIRSEGLSLKQLSTSVNLAHSTTSGIVDRLERQGLVERTISKVDRRLTVLTASKAVRVFLEKRMPEMTLHPLKDALSNATHSERKQLVDSLDLLARLLSPSNLDPLRHDRQASTL